MSVIESEVTAKAPCSSANLGPGFDSFGLALAGYYDHVRVSLSKNIGIKIRVRGTNSHHISSDPNHNSAGPPAKTILRKTSWMKGLDIIIEKNVPPGLGLGSSGATAVATTKALDTLFDLDLSNEELVKIASLGEKAVSGTAHMDNVAASLMGGFVIIYGEPAKIVSLKPPRNLSCIVAIPQAQITKTGKTKLARKLVPENIPVQKAVWNIGHASAIAAGFASGNVDLIGSGMQDEIAEPARQQLFPAYPIVKRAAIENGAAGVSISGAGPSIIAIADRRHSNPGKIANAMKRTFNSLHVHSNIFITIPAKGAEITNENR